MVFGFSSAAHDEFKFRFITPQLDLPSFLPEVAISGNWNVSNGLSYTPM